MWTGAAAEGERRFAAMRSAASAILDDVADKPYTAIDSVHTDPLDPTPAYEAACVLGEFPEDAADALLALTGPGTGSPQVLVEVRQLGGAFAQPGEHPSAFASRAAAYSVLVVGIAEVPGVRDHAAAVLDALAPWVGGRRLPNFTFAPEEYVDAYHEVTLARLRRTIRAYDPGPGPDRLDLQAVLGGASQDSALTPLDLGRLDQSRLQPGIVGRAELDRELVEATGPVVLVGRVGGARTHLANRGRNDVGLYVIFVSMAVGPQDLRSRRVVSSGCHSRSPPCSRARALRVRRPSVVVSSSSSRRPSPRWSWFRSTRPPRRPPARVGGVRRPE